jgi:peptide/nickel transport system permease protein
MGISFAIALIATVFEFMIAIPLGITAATHQYSLRDYIVTILVMIGISLPSFFFGNMLKDLFALKLGWLPSFGVSDWKGLILPTISIGLPNAARQMRFTRSSMLESIREDYVRTARAKGCEERTVIWKHALKNALLPVITVLGNSFGAMFGGTVIIEKLFSIPGIGTYMVDGITNRDVPVVTGCVVAIALVYSLVTMLVDVLYAYIDPRTKARFIK